jgi:hypothetical protein
VLGSFAIFRLIGLLLVRVTILRAAFRALLIFLLLGPDWHQGFSAPEWYLIPKAAFALMPITLVIQYRVKACKLTICPSQRIYVWTFRPCLNKVPFQLVQLLAHHKTTPTLIALLMPRRKQT